MPATVSSRLSFLGLLLLVWLPVTASGQTIEMASVWARESPPLVTTGAVYLDLVNKSASADRLLAVAGSIADRLEIHTHVHEDGLTKMRHLEILDIPPGETIRFEPGGLHIMLIGLQAPLVRGATFPLTFSFEAAGTIRAVANVKSISAIK